MISYLSNLVYCFCGGFAGNFCGSVFWMLGELFVGKYYNKLSNEEIMVKTLSQYDTNVSFNNDGICFRFKTDNQINASVGDNISIILRKNNNTLNVLNSRKCEGG